MPSDSHQTKDTRICPSRRLTALLGCVVLIFLLPVSVTAAESASSADELMQRGLAAARQGALEEAHVALRDAARLYDQAGQVRKQIQALSQAAYMARALGHVTQAFQYQELAHQLAQQLNEPQWLALTLAELGKSYIASGEYEEAAAYLTDATDIADTHRLPRLSASLRNDIGVLRALQGRPAEALDSFQQSAASAKEESLHVLFVRAQVNVARTALQLKQAGDAETALKEAERVVMDLPASHEKTDGLISLGLGYRDLARAQGESGERSLNRAAGLLQEAATLSEASKDSRLLSYAYGHLGHLYETEYRLEEALHLSRKAVFAAQSAGAAESLYRWQWQSGRLLQQLGRIDEAVAAYQEAAATVQPIRSEVTLASLTATGRGQQVLRSLYFELADLLLQRAALMGEDPQAQDYLEAARDAIEVYKAAELRDYFRDDCVDQLQARVTKLESVSSGTAIIYPIVFPDRTEMLVSAAQGFKRVPVSVPADVLTAEIRSFRRMLEKRTTREYLPHAQQLYDWLIRPIEGYLRSLNVDTLVIVPDGPLRTVPLSALHDGKDFLITQYAIATSPGLELTDPRPIDRTRVQLLSSGLTQGVQGFPPLPYVAEEVDRIRSVFKGEQLLDSEFVTPRLERELSGGQYGILHIATHGKFATESNQSFLLTFDGKLTVTKLEQLVGLFRFREDPLELLTLSACQTGVGDDRAALGLAGIAVKAGARSALATLWFINDEASAELVAEFYKQLHDTSISKARALQRAQMKLLSDRVYAHPAYWAAFLLLNNWL